MEDAANWQEAEKSGISSTSGEFPALIIFFFVLITFFIVHDYIEGMKTVCNFWLAAVSSEDIEFTKSAVGQQVLNI